MAERISLGCGVVMKISLKVLKIVCQPGAKKNLVKEEKESLKVFVTARPVDGKANQAVVEILAEHFGVKKSRIEIIKGLKSRNKTISITEF